MHLYRPHRRKLELSNVEVQQSFSIGGCYLAVCRHAEDGEAFEVNSNFVAEYFQICQITFYGSSAITLSVFDSEFGLSVLGKTFRPAGEEKTCWSDGRGTILVSFGRGVACLTLGVGERPSLANMAGKQKLMGG